MRHAGTLRPKPLGSLGMRHAPLQAALVAPTSLTQRSPTSQPSASVGAVDLAAVAARADMHVLAAKRTEKEPSCIVHRRSQSADEPSTSASRACYTSARTCACHGGGHGIRMESQVLPGCRARFSSAESAPKFSGVGTTLPQRKPAHRARTSASARAIDHNGFTGGGGKRG
jgi:hypothetical protein